jgi:hypothetical protein
MILQLQIAVIQVAGFDVPSTNISLLACLVISTVGQKAFA